MPWQRVGLVPNTDHEHAQHLHRAAVMVSRDASDLEERGRYARAVLGTLAQPVGHSRLAQVGAIVIWGSDDTAVGQAMLRHRAATMVVVLKARPRKGSKVATAIAKLTNHDHRVEVYTIPAKVRTVRAIDVGTDRQVVNVASLQRPPQQQHAPSTPRK